MGDAAAVAITKVVADKDLDADLVNRIILVITMAFAAPEIVDVQSDRQPRTILFLLRYLDSSTKDPELKKKVVDTRTYVLEQYARSKEESQIKSNAANKR